MPYKSKSKRAIYSSRYYYKNHERWLAYNKRSRRIEYKFKRELINRSKMKPCLDCNIQYNPWIMEFDHREPKLKSFSIGQSSWKRIDQIKEEIEKCDVVCANCHKERTHNQILKFGHFRNLRK